MRRALAKLAIIASLALASSAGASTDRHDVYKAAATAPGSNLTLVCYDHDDVAAINCASDFALANGLYLINIAVTYLP